MPQRISKKTLFICCEGQDEKVFVDYIKNNFAQRNISIKVRNAQGGSPLDIILFCIKRGYGFDKKIIFMDSDIEISDSERELINKHDIHLIQSVPSIEAQFLELVDDESSFSQRRIKKYFRDRYLGSRRGIRIDDCHSLFPIKKIQEKRQSMSNLDSLINFIQGNF